MNLDERPLTKLEILSMVSKIFYSLRFAPPFLLVGKSILQVLRKRNYNCDEAASDDYIEDWNKWKKELQLMEGLEINRCFKTSKLGKVYIIFQVQAKMDMGKCYSTY